MKKSGDCEEKRGWEGVGRVAGYMDLTVSYSTDVRGVWGGEHKTRGTD